MVEQAKFALHLRTHLAMTYIIQDRDWLVDRQAKMDDDETMGGFKGTSTTSRAGGYKYHSSRLVPNLG